MLKLISWTVELVACVLMGNYLVRFVIKNTRPEPPGPLTLPLGFLEILSYTVSYIMGFPVFITVWLALKTANRWKVDRTPSHLTNSFLIGNLLSVLVGVYLGAIFRSLLIDMHYLGIIKKYFLP